MDALDYENVFRPQCLIIALVLPLTGFKIKAGKFHGFSRQQIEHIFVKLFYVDRFQAFKVIVPVFVPGRILPVYKIIVQRDRMGRQPISAQLYRQSVGKCSFSRRRGACDHNKFYPFPFHNLPCDLTDPPLLKRLLHENQIIDISLADLIIQIPHRPYIDHISPIVGLFERLKQFFPRFHRRQFFRRFRIRKQKHQAILISKHLEIFHISRTRQHIAVIIIIISVQTVHIYIRTSSISEQFFFLFHILAAEDLHRIVQRIRFFHIRQVGLHQLPHPPV